MTALSLRIIDRVLWLKKTCRYLDIYGRQCIVIKVLLLTETAIVLFFLEVSLFCLLFLECAIYQIEIVPSGSDD